MKLSVWRATNNYTQKDVAKVVGVDSTMVSKYERGLAKPTIFHLAIIHRLTNKQVTVEDFLYGDETSKVNSVNYKSPKNTLYSGPSKTRSS